MKTVYDYDEHNLITVTHTCTTCGYEDKSDGYGNNSFIEMEGFELHSTDRSGYYPRDKRHTVYACPKCGVLQIEVD